MYVPVVRQLKVAPLFWDRVARYFPSRILIDTTMLLTISTYLLNFSIQTNHIFRDREVPGIRHALCLYCRLPP